MTNATVLSSISGSRNQGSEVSRNSSHCVVVIDRTQARFFRYALGGLSQIEMREFKIDKSQWKMKDHAHMARRDTKMPHGAERDVFKKRLDAQYLHFCRETANEIRIVCQKYKLTGVVLVGSARLIEPIVAALPTEIRPRATMIPKDLARLSLSELKDYLTPAIQQWEIAQEAGFVGDLLSAEHGSVSGIDETLAQLQEGRIRQLVMAEDLDARLSQCVKCGLTSRSADRLCPDCGSPRKHIQLRAVLPVLAKLHEAGVELVGGDAAKKLMTAGGMGGWLRQRRQARA